MVYYCFTHIIIEIENDIFKFILYIYIHISIVKLWYMLGISMV